MRRSLITATCVGLWLACLAVHAATSAEEGRTDGGTSPTDELVQVNEGVITRRELDRYVELSYMTEEMRVGYEQFGPVEREEFLAGVRKQALEGLIDRHLLLQRARRELLSHEAAEEMLDQYAKEHVEKIIERMGSRIAFRRFLLARGISVDEFLNVQKESILIGEYLRAKVDARVHVAPAEIRRYYREHTEEFRKPGQIVCRQLWVDPADCATREEERQKARRILEQIQQGADFAQMADRHSLDRGKYPGGLHVLEGPAQGGQRLRNVLAALQPGEVSGIHEIGGSYCIVKLERIVEPRVLAFEEVCDSIRRRLREQRRAEELRALIGQLRADARLRYYPAGERIRAHARAFEISPPVH